MASSTGITIFSSQVADVFVWEAFPSFMEVAEFSYFEFMWWVSWMGQILSASESSSRVSDLLLVLISPSALQERWQSTEEAEYDDQKDHEGALPEENLKETLL